MSPLLRKFEPPPLSLPRSFSPRVPFSTSPVQVPILIYGAVLAVQTRQLYDEGINESTWIAVAMWTTGAALLLNTGVLYLDWTGETFAVRTQEAAHGPEPTP